MLLAVNDKLSIHGPHRLSGGNVYKTITIQVEFTKLDLDLDIFYWSQDGKLQKVPESLLITWQRIILFFLSIDIISWHVFWAILSTCLFSKDWKWYKGWVFSILCSHADEKQYSTLKDMKTVSLKGKDLWRVFISKCWHASIHSQPWLSYQKKQTKANVA